MGIMIAFIPFLLFANSTGRLVCRLRDKLIYCHSFVVCRLFCIFVFVYGEYT